MLIRPFVDRDREAVIALWREVEPNPAPHNDPAAVIDHKLDVQRELFFIAEEGASIVGTVMAGYDGHRGWIYSLVVAPSRRRRGIGSALMRHAEKALAELGCPKLNLQVRAGNDSAVAFYRMLGYDEEARISMGKLLPPNADVR